LPDWAQFVETLNRLGIQSQPATSIVVYDDSRFAFAARLWWMLRYLGHDQVALLDGGFSAWHQAGLPITQALPTVKRGDFRAQPQPDWLVDIEAVRQRKDLPGVKLVDARAEERFRGEYEPIDPIAGSIPGAVNSFWQAVTDEAGYLKPTSDLIEHWSALDDAREVIMYCGSGVTACVNLFAQTMAGQPMGKLYSGGWSDWCSYQV
jgi:thiosulfate/3-mercaptopyruvate sulfurtransferase